MVSLAFKQTHPVDLNLNAESENPPAAQKNEASDKQQSRYKRPV